LNVANDRSYPLLGAHVVDGGVRFAVWAPERERVDVQIETSTGPEHHLLEKQSTDVHVGLVPEASAGTRYRFRLDDGDAFPDPRSRFQPEGVHGPSEVIDPSTFEWTDQEWSGLSADRLIIYELHVGTFTGGGTFSALETELEYIKRLGVTAIEIMPIADFPGRWNWGYDGVALFAPSRAYGQPDDLRRLIDRAHAVGLGVLLDVVYNHFGPDGNYLRLYSDDYFTDRHMTPWGEGINYDGPNSRFVRDLVIDNVRQWVREFHVDGFRLDATDPIVDDSSVHILEELTEAARAAIDRPVIVIAEEARNDVRTFRPQEKGGLGLDGVWADDFHNAMRVYLSNAQENYFADFEGRLDEISKAINEGFLYQGAVSPQLGRPRGTKVTDEPATAFVFCIQNHDQVGNRPFGDRLHHEINIDKYKVASALLLVSPETPLLFMGQEFAASTPFLYFTDHHEELGKLVTEGRREEFGGFREFAHEGDRELIPDPQAESTFLASKLDVQDRERGRDILKLYQDLLSLRLSDLVLSVPDRQHTHATPLGVHALALVRWHGDQARLIMANFGTELSITSEDLEKIHPVLTRRSASELLFSTDDSTYGGHDRASLDSSAADGHLTIPPRSASLYGFTLKDEISG
jgi:maltooligosyltrehalose trehalohydrolase